MRLQSEWIKQLNPLKSIVKFRAPYAYSNYCLDQLKNTTSTNTTNTTNTINCYYNYLEGELLIQPWARHISSELRLIISRPIREVQYNCNDIDDKMMHLNIIMRTIQSMNYKGTMLSFDQYQENAIIDLFKSKYPKFKHFNFASIFQQLKSKHSSK